MKCLVIDTETGGTDPAVHSILSIAAVVWDDGEVGATIGPLYIEEPVMCVTPGAMRVNKLDLASIEWMRPVNATTRLRAFCREHFGDGAFVPIVGHNVSFDRGFVERLERLARDRVLWDRRAICTLGIWRFLAEVACVMDVPPNYRLETAATLFGLGEQRHDALGDAMLCAQLLTRLRAASRASVSRQLA
jgi:DNA polymerase III epsilon subunit-like protein